MLFFFFQAEDGIRDVAVTGVQTCALPISVGAVLFLPCNRGDFRTGPLVPPVEAREVTRIPCLAESGGAQVPVGADFARHRPQIMPEVCNRRAAPKPEIGRASCRERV